MKNSYVALLRGINVGGNKKVPMAELKTLFEKEFDNVRTILNSGNVVFESETKPSPTKTQHLIEKHFKFTVATQIFPLNKIEDFLKKHPLNKELKQYASFINNKIIYNSTKGPSVELMKDLDKKYSKEITTRTLRTLKRMCL